MQTFFEALDARMDQFWLLYRRDSVNGPPAGIMGPGDFETHFYPPGTLEIMGGSLERAMALAEDEAVKARLRLVELEFDYLKSLALVRHMYRAYRLSPSWETLGLVEKQVERFAETRGRVWPEGERMEIPGVPSPFAGASARGAGGAPFNWNFDRLREKGVLPGVERKRVAARRVEAFPLDGRIGKPVWDAIPFEEVGEIGMGETPRETFFKVAYDAENLYFAFKGALPSPEALDGVVPVGRDGGAWRQENLELVIDPVGTRRMYYHFIVNPVPDSTLERRFGYFEDPDHPLYQDFEWDWRGEWEYAPRIDREGMFWSAEVRIPFDTLEAEPPRPGDTWTFNVGRTEYPEEGGNIVYLWSPNIESRTFHDTSAFGELIFR